jgi:CRISPR-associated protein Csb1
MLIATPKGRVVGNDVATYRTKDGDSLLVESSQSMANRLEMTVWDEARQDVKEDLDGISHIRIIGSNGRFLTDTILESHRLNSPYLLEESSKAFLRKLQQELGVMETGPVNRQTLAQVLLKYDVGSLLHGVFLAKKELAGGRLRVARSVTAFIEADGIEVAPSGGVKNDHVNPSWPKQNVEKGFGNVPFARDEYTAREITLYVNLDLAQIRGFRLDKSEERMLILLALYKVRALLDGGLRLRTACDLCAKESSIGALQPKGFPLPGLAEIKTDVKAAVDRCKGRMEVTTETFGDEIKVKHGDDATASEEAFTSEE